MQLRSKSGDFMISDLSNKIKGLVGEFSVRNILNCLPEDKYFLLNDKLLKNTANTTQVDHIVASIYGIFVIETKNYSGTVYGNEYADKWTQYICGHKYPFHNPIKQNYAHIEAIRKLHPVLNDLNYISIIVFPNDIKLNVTSTKAHVIHASELLQTILSYSEKTTSLNSVYTVRHLVNEDNKDNIFKRFSHTKNVKKHIETVSSANTPAQVAVSANTAIHICGKCGQQMTYHSKGRYGPYYSCESCKINISEKKLKS